MADTFGDLGLRSELGEATRELGYESPTALQRAAIPVLRRGGNAVLHASAGAGVVGAWGLALLDRLADSKADADAAPRALVLVPTHQTAARTAESLARPARAVGLRTAATGAGWEASQQADVVVTTPATALEAVQTSALKLDAVEALVLDGAAAIFALGGEDAVETLTSFIPREAQRVVVTAKLSPAVEKHLERHVRKALRIPPVPVEEAPSSEAKRPLEYVIAPGADKTATLAVLLAERTARGAVVHCRTAEHAAKLADELTLRGFRATPDEDSIRVSGEAETGDEDAGIAISYDVPFDADTLQARHDDGGVVIIEPRELVHLRLIAGRANFSPKATPAPLPVAAADEVTGFRDRIRQALAEEDVGAQLLVLEPLFAEHSPAEVAAALAALLRRRAPAAAPASPRAETSAPATRRPAAPAGAPAGPTYVRLFVGAGSREDIRPGDLVGAITGETGTKGDQVGRIEIRENFSIVEVTSDIADKVIRALNGTTLKGRSLRVDYDRRPSGGGRGGRGGEQRPRRRIVRHPGR